LDIKIFRRIDLKWYALTIFRDIKVIEGYNMYGINSP
jgi:hypothetical protein